MKPELFTYYGYLELGKQGDLIENALRQKVHGLMGYEKEAVVKRLVQNFMVLLFVPFLRMQTKFFMEGKGNILETSSSVLRFDNLIINLKTGEVTVCAKLFWSCIIKFFLSWLMISGVWFLSLFCLNSQKKTASLLYGIPLDNLKYNNNDARFVDYYLHGPLKEIQDVDLVVVESNQKINATRPDRFKYGRIPQLELLLSSGLSIGQNVMFFKQHVYALVKYLHILCLSPLYCLLWRDIAEHALTESLNDAGLISHVVITNSTWHNQYLWMFALPQRRFKTFMALYSLNSHSFVYKDDPIYGPYPTHRYLFVDTIWIWFEKYKEMLVRDKIMIHTEAKDPILWYRPEPSHRTENDEFKICVFDVTPRAKTWLQEKLGSPFTYYNYDTVKGFYEGILSAVREAQEATEKTIRIIVKRKREKNFSDDVDYHTYLDKINEENENLSFVNYDDNLFNLIGECDLSITLPFSSTAYVTCAMNLPAIFYDPTDTLVFNHPDVPMVEFISNHDKLIAAIGSAIEKRNLGDQ